MNKLTIILTTACIAFITMHTQAQDILDIEKTNFGGSNDEYFNAVTAVSDGTIAVGYAWAASFGTGDWAGVTGKGNYDAIAVKYNNNGNIVWKKNFGGSDAEQFNAVTAVSGGFIAVGYAQAASFGNGDWADVTGKGYDDAIAVKYDNNGNIVWKKNFGGSSDDYFNAVTAVSDGIIAVGYSSSFGTGDWAGVTGKGYEDAIAVKYDNNGNIVWKKSFGGSDGDFFHSVTAVSDGIIAVGYAYAASFGTGDWTGVTGKGGMDAIAVKYDNNGNIVWKKNVGGSDKDLFKAITAVSDGFIAVGYSFSKSFGTGDWTGVTGKGNDDAIAVKYNNAGNIVWKKNFGGSAEDCFLSVTAVSDGIIAVGYSLAASFGDGDWTGVTGKGDVDAIAVKYDNTGNIVWKKNFGGSDWDQFNAVTAVSGDIVAVGYSYPESFGNGDWAGVTGKGSSDAIAVKYITYKAVTDIIDIPTTATLNTVLQLTGTVVPSNASKQTINWLVVNPGTTNATISGNDFFAPSEGVAFIKATIIDGIATGTDYVQNFSITVSKDVSIAEIAASKINIYPNPTTGQLTIQWTRDNGQLTMKHIEILDMYGRNVKQFSILHSQFSIEELSSGIYFIRIKTENGEAIRKIVKK